ncbi:MAG: HupE/UreJ family protein [Pseudomonadales bacterium]
MRTATAAGLTLALLLAATSAAAHNVAASDGSFLSTAKGIHLGPYLYLGAKHMVTGIDHLLFLAGVIFFLRQVRDVAIYASLFALGHSITLLVGVLNGWQVNVYLVDALIAISVIYKAADNLGTEAMGRMPIRWAIFGFGLIHGLGLASKLQGFSLDPEAILANMLAFNVGVELGQLLALWLMWCVLRTWQPTPGFTGQARLANWAIACAGLVLLGYQITGYYLQSMAL